jgi:hypothetical protein
MSWIKFKPNELTEYSIKVSQITTVALREDIEGSATLEVYVRGSQKPFSMSYSIGYIMKKYKEIMETIAINELP